MNSCKVLILPKWDQANPYLRLLSSALKANNCEVHIDDFSVSLLPIFFVALYHKRRHGLDVIHIHWVSQIIMRISWSQNPLIFYAKCFFLALDLALCKMLGIKLVWTIHNKISHESKNQKREIIIRKLILFFIDRVILHSPQAADAVQNLYRTNLNRKLKIIYHGNYEGCYPAPSASKNNLRSQHGLSENDKVFLFFGSIKPYKGVELLVSVANRLNTRPDLKVIIAGEPSTDLYRSNLLSNIESENILTKFSFLNDQQMIDYLELCDSVILPFVNTLTSGSVLLTMTQGRALILPENAKIFGCINAKGAFYFNDSDDLFKLMNDLTKEEMVSAGKINLNSAENLDWSGVGSLTSEVYR